jgi:hypothetical protein
MKSRDLIAELDRAQRALDAGHRDKLHNLGISPPTVGRGLVGIARVQLSATGRIYWPDEDGAEAFITPARIGEDPSSPQSAGFEVVPQYGDVIDLIAWSPMHPGKWALRSNLADWLGAIPPQFMTPPPVVVRHDVLSWLRNDAEGLVVFNRTPLDAYRVLSICREIEAEDFAHARELRRILEHPFPVPTISVAGRAPGRWAA